MVSLPSNAANIIRQRWGEISAVLRTPWLSPTDATARLHSSFQRDIVGLKLTVAGAPDLPFLIGDSGDALHIVSLDGHITEQPFVQELTDRYGARFTSEDFTDGETPGLLLKTRMNSAISRRLLVPSVALVSLFHPEMYPASRLTLGVSYLASYLRLRHAANADIFDCQFGASVASLLRRFKKRRPDIIGISVNFGQIDLMEEFLEGLRSTFRSDEQPTVILGNILPSMSFREILRRHPDVLICRKEGELAIASLARYHSDPALWTDVPGVYFRDRQTGRLVETPVRSLPLEDLPSPALDTLADLFANGCYSGVLFRSLAAHLTSSSRTRSSWDLTGMVPRLTD